MFDGFRDFQAEAGNYNLLVLENICLEKIFFPYSVL